MELEGGKITAFLEAAATAVGVGVVLGGFIAGLVGLLSGWDRETLDLRVVKYGYAGATACVVLRLIDMASV